MKLQNRTCSSIQTACSNLTNSTLACQKHPPPHRPLLKDLSLTPGIALENWERGYKWVTGVNHSQNHAETTIHSQTAGQLSMITLFCMVVLTCLGPFQRDEPSQPISETNNQVLSFIPQLRLEKAPLSSMISQLYTSIYPYDFPASYVWLTKLFAILSHQQNN